MVTASQDFVNRGADVATAPTAGEGAFKYYAPVTAVKTFYRLIKP